MVTLNIVLIDTFDLGDNVYEIEIQKDGKIFETGLKFTCSGDSDFILQTAKKFLSDKLRIVN